MTRSRSDFSSDVAHEIAHSKSHWSELSDTSSLSDRSRSLDQHDEALSRENAEVYVELLLDPQWESPEFNHFFFTWMLSTASEMHGWKLGPKIAEGGQAEIFEIVVKGVVHPNKVLKVFKPGSRLSDLRKQWPRGIITREVLCLTLGGLLLDDGRFAFAMVKCWGDLRKFIDQIMQQNSRRGSAPFPYKRNGKIWHAREVMKEIALQMAYIHGKGLVHRDLKASNILLWKDGIIVADFECSIGVVGTGLWKAPEILMGLRTGNALDFTHEVDVYGYAMICFEIVTGRLPFEGELEPCCASYDLVIEGQRPKLPRDLDASIRNLIEQCWSPSPNHRPSFQEILEVLES